MGEKLFAANGQDVAFKVGPVPTNTSKDLEGIQPFRRLHLTHFISMLYHTVSGSYLNSWRRRKIATLKTRFEWITEWASACLPSMPPTILQSRLLA
jgi:hypothetical protein